MASFHGRAPALGLLPLHLLLYLVAGVLLLLLRLPSSAHATSVHYCDRQATYDVKVYAVDISPDPVLSGKPATFSIFATSGDTINGGKLVIDVYIWGIHVHSEKHDLCGGTSCPISPGDFVLSHRQSLPGITPPGTYTLKMKMVGSDGRQLTCINFGFKVTYGSLVADG